MYASATNFTSAEAIKKVTRLNENMDRFNDHVRFDGHFVAIWYAYRFDDRGGGRMEDRFNGGTRVKAKATTCFQVKLHIA